MVSEQKPPQRSQRSQQEVVQILKDFLKNRLEIETEDLTAATELESLGIDSLMQMELIFDFEEKFSFRMPEVEDRPVTVGELVDLIKAHLPDLQTSEDSSASLGSPDSSGPPKASN